MGATTSFTMERSLAADLGRDLSEDQPVRGWWLAVPGQPDELIYRVPDELRGDLPRARARGVSMSLACAAHGQRPSRGSLPTLQRRPARSAVAASAQIAQQQLVGGKGVWFRDNEGQPTNGAPYLVDGVESSRKHPRLRGRGLLHRALRVRVWRGRGTCGDGAAGRCGCALSAVCPGSSDPWDYLSGGFGGRS